MNPRLEVQEVPISGHARHITLRHYRPTFEKRVLPIVLYFHGGGFVSGDLDDANPQASALAEALPAWVISVGYSLAPAYPFPTATEDAYLALHWAADNAQQFKADAEQLFVAGHDAGATIANGLAAMARDRAQMRIAAQALIAPLLDPSLTWFDCELCRDWDLDGHVVRAQAYRAWLPSPAAQMHPYAAPLESRRLAGMPRTLIVSGERDPARAEAEAYAGRLIAAGVHTEAIRRPCDCHRDLLISQGPIADVSHFFRRLIRI